MSLQPREQYTRNVLDGYVRLVDVMGSDLTVVNAARVSFNKESFQLSDKDKKLIKFLATHGHTSPFRHATMQFEVYAPLMVARQWWKYIVGSSHNQDPLGAWNESSRRYVTEEPEFYIPLPHDWRLAPENRKQGSGGSFYAAEPSEAHNLTNELREIIRQGVRRYERALELGVTPEQARLFLPAYALLVRWYWTCSLQAVAHFLDQRLAEDAQGEIQQYAREVAVLVLPFFETSLRELLKDSPELEEMYVTGE